LLDSPCRQGNLKEGVSFVRVFAKFGVAISISHSRLVEVLKRPEDMLWAPCCQGGRSVADLNALGWLLVTRQYEVCAVERIQAERRARRLPKRFLRSDAQSARCGKSTR
jgi:hypothetical protein